MGQIATKEKVYGETNHPKTCISYDTLTANSILVASGNRTISIKPSTRRAILITDASGNAAFIEVPDGDAGKNKLLVTDINKNLVWIDQ